MFEGSIFIVQIILREKRGNFNHFLNKSTVSVYEHKIAESVNYKDYKSRLPTFEIDKKFPNSLIENSMQMQNSREKEVIAIVELEGK